MQEWTMTGDIAEVDTAGQVNDGVTDGEFKL